MAALTYRACCSSPTAPGVYYSDPDAPPAGAGPDIPAEVEAVQRSFETAMHESGHAAICHLLGVRVLTVKIGPRSFVERDVSDAKDMSNFKMVMLAQAGDVAARWAKRHIYQPHDEEYLESIRRVRSQCFGKCDACLAAVFALAEVGGSDNTNVVATMRAIERQTVEILTSRPVTLAITALADQLMAEGSVNRPGNSGGCLV